MKFAGRTLESDRIPIPAGVRDDVATQAQGLSSGTIERLSYRQVVGTLSTEQPKDQEQLRNEHEFLQDARERFRESVNAESKRRGEMLEDLQFKCGIQWRQTDLAQREAQGRPCLTINRVPGFVSHVVNNMRQSRPEIKVDPIADGADEEIAEVRQGIIRHIELVSRAEIAYDTAFDNLCTIGLGYVRVVDTWSDLKSMDKDLRIEWLPNSFSVYEDGAAYKPDWSDGEYKFVVEDISLQEFRRRFGKDKSPVSLNEFTSIGDSSKYWLIGNKIRIAEYFHIEEEDDVLCEFEDGSTEYASLLSADKLDECVATRPAKVPTVFWTLMYGLGILKQQKWPGRYIPIIPFIGNQVELDGERIVTGMVRYAKEAQRMFNYMYSCFVEGCALAPKSPFVAEYSQIEDFRETWQTANTSPTSYLPYKAKTIDGQLVPAPHREQAEPPIQAFVEGLKLADENLKSVFRIFDASLGQRGPQESGLAINSRKIESDLATYDWIDNFTRGLRFLGIVLDDLLPHYYNRPGRIVQVLQEDLTLNPTVINKLHNDPDGIAKIYDLSKGRFAITISTGPGVATKRQDAAKSMVEIAKYYPQLWQVCGPQIIRQMDWPGKDAIAAQLEKAMPPELREEDPNAPKDTPEQLKATLNQMSQQNKLMAQALTEATDKNSAEHLKEMFATLREQMADETALAIASLKVGSQEAAILNERIFAELERVRALVEPQTIDSGGGKPRSSGAPSAAAPAQPSSPPTSGEATPAEVGIGT